MELSISQRVAFVLSPLLCVSGVVWGERRAFLLCFKRIQYHPLLEKKKGGKRRRGLHSAILDSSLLKTSQESKGKMSKFCGVVVTNDGLL